MIFMKIVILGQWFKLTFTYTIHKHTQTLLFYNNGIASVGLQAGITFFTVRQWVRSRAKIY